MNSQPVAVGRARTLTLADLLTELNRYRYDPETVTFRTGYGPVMTCDDDYDIGREHGALVVTLGPDHEW